MDFNSFLTTLQSSLGGNIPMILGAIAILVVGLLLAAILRSAARKLLSKLKLNSSAAQFIGSSVNLENLLSQAVFFLVLLAALIGTFSLLNISSLSGPLGDMLNSFLSFIPRIIGAAVIGLIAFVLAKVLKMFTTKALSIANVDNKLMGASDEDATELTNSGNSISNNLSNIVFWLVILFFIPAILDALQLDGLLQPVQGMLNDLLGALPNVLYAGLIGFVGWIIAKLLRNIVTSVVSSFETEKISAQAGLSKDFNLGKLAGTVVYILVLVPTLIAALQQLNISAISDPAISMLQQFMSAVPNIIGAVIIVTLAWFLARFISGLVKTLLQNTGADDLPSKINMQSIFSGATAPSNLASGLIMFFIMLFGIVSAFDQLQLTQVSELLTNLTQFAGDVLLGSVIMVIGFWLSNLVFTALNKGEGSAMIANIARFAIIGLVVAMGLRAMGIANEIVNLAFGLTLAAISVAVALAFGLGGREAAGKLLDRWFNNK